MRVFQALNFGNADICRCWSIVWFGGKLGQGVRKASSVRGSCDVDVVVETGRGGGGDDERASFVVVVNRAAVDDGALIPVQ